MVPPRRLQQPLATWTRLFIAILILAPIESAEVAVNCTTPQPNNASVIESNTTYLLEDCSASTLLYSNSIVGLSNVAIFVRGGTALPNIQLLSFTSDAIRNFSLSIDSVVATTDHPSTPLLSVEGMILDSSITVINCSIIVREPSVVLLPVYYVMFLLGVAEVKNMTIDMQDSSIRVTQTFAVASVYVFTFVTNSLVDNIKITVSFSRVDVVEFLTNCAIISFRLHDQSTLAFSNVSIAINSSDFVVSGQNTNVDRILNTSASVVLFASLTSTNAILNGTSRVSIKDSDVSLITAVGGSLLTVDRFQSLEGGSFVVDIENVTANIVISSRGMSPTSSTSAVNLGLVQSVGSFRVNVANVTVNAIMSCEDPPALTFVAHNSALVLISAPTVSNITISVRASSLQSMRNTSTQGGPLSSNLYYILTFDSHIVMFRNTIDGSNVSVTLSDVTLTASLNASLLSTSALVQVGYAHCSLILCAVDVLVDSSYNESLQVNICLSYSKRSSCSSHDYHHRVTHCSYYIGEPIFQNQCTIENSVSFNVNRSNSAPCVHGDVQLLTSHTFSHSCNEC